jgi:hypothetical protein
MSPPSQFVTHPGLAAVPGFEPGLWRYRPTGRCALRWAHKYGNNAPARGPGERGCVVVAMTGQQALAGGLWLAAAGAAVAGRRIPRQVAPVALAAASVVTAVVVSYDLTAREGNRITDVILGRLTTERFLTEQRRGQPLRVAR